LYNAGYEIGLYDGKHRIYTFRRPGHCAVDPTQEQRSDGSGGKRLDDDACIGIIEQKPNGRIIQLLLDEPNAYYADPFDIAITPDGKKAFVSHGGVDCISVIDIDAIRETAGRKHQTICCMPIPITSGSAAGM